MSKVRRTIFSGEFYWGEKVPSPRASFFKESWSSKSSCKALWLLREGKQSFWSRVWWTGCWLYIKHMWPQECSWHAACSLHWNPRHAQRVWAWFRTLRAQSPFETSIHLYRCLHSTEFNQISACEKMWCELPQCNSRHSFQEMPLILRYTLDILTESEARNPTRLNILIDCKVPSDSRNV